MVAGTNAFFVATLVRDRATYPLVDDLLSDAGSLIVNFESMFAVRDIASCHRRMGQVLDKSLMPQTLQNKKRVGSGAWKSTRHESVPDGAS